MENVMAATRKPTSEKKLKEQWEKYFTAAINGTSPLACALIVTSFIENALMTLLDSFLADCTTSKGLFKSGNSLGDLSKCADFAYCLGFISSPMLNNIKQIGEIRNIFAHSPEFIDFADAKLKEALAAMTFPKAISVKSDALNIQDGPDNVGAFERIAGNNPRAKFQLVAMMLYTWINFEINKVTHTNSKPDTETDYKSNPDAIYYKRRRLQDFGQVW
jgi:hypothetical protein